MKVSHSFFKDKSTRILASICLVLQALFISSCATNSIRPCPQNAKKLAASMKRPLDGGLYPFTHFDDGSSIVTSKNAFKSKDTILLTFAGDLMAHVPLWDKGKFEQIYEAVSPYIKGSDFSFTNLETPVCDRRPYSGYPGFNVHHEYADASIDAGFNVFSLTNNHTNDQGLEGINATRDYFKSVAEKTKYTERPVYYAGLKEEKNAPLTYQVIKKDGWTILYVAITELLNSTTNRAMIDYVPPSSAERESFIKDIKNLQEKNPADLFIISIHCSDPEYVFDIRAPQDNWYRRLLDAGADVVWVNHPHVAKDWELIPDSDNVARKIIFHSMGNFISRHESRRNTGEGFMTQVVFEKTPDGGIRIAEINPILLTTYKTKNDHYVIKKLDEDFLDWLSVNDPAQKSFFKERLSFMKKISGKVKWQ